MAGGACQSAETGRCERWFSRTATVFPGESVGAAATALGEAVFTTGMTGYQEVVTDPSFCGQLVCFTAPMVGNYGVAEHRGRVRRAARARRSSCERRAAPSGRIGSPSTASRR